MRRAMIVFSAGVILITAPAFIARGQSLTSVIFLTPGTALAIRTFRPNSEGRFPLKPGSPKFPILGPGLRLPLVWQVSSHVVGLPQRGGHRALRRGARFLLKVPAHEQGIAKRSGVPM